MSTRTTTIKRILIASAIPAMALLSACGGGSNDQAAPSHGNSGSGSSTLNPGLTGKFWYRPDASNSYFHANAQSGAVTKFGDRPTAYPSKFLVPSPDGTRFILQSRLVDAGTDYEGMQIDLFDSATQTKLSSMTLDGFATNFRFSQDNKSLGMLISRSLIAQQEGLVVFDLSTEKTPRRVVSFYGSKDLYVRDFDWLPNGQYLYLRSDNKLISGTPITGGSDDAERGELIPPTGHQVASSIALSPNGDQLLLMLKWADGASTDIDVWVASSAGKNLERVTNSTMTMSPRWSPDGSHIAFKTDAGAYCISGSCNSYCKRWYAPRTARGITENSGGVALRAYSDLAFSTPSILPCYEDFHWTR